ncbi:hypothetical protein E4U34_008371, partial [Claviceps purpurea]
MGIKAWKTCIRRPPQAATFRLSVQNPYTRELQTTQITGYKVLSGGPTLRSGAGTLLRGGLGE